MSFKLNLNYHDHLRLNLRLGMVRAFLFSLMFFIPVWFEFETWYMGATALATVYSVAHLVTVVLEMPTGALADLLGRRKTMILGALTWVIGYAVISQQTAGWMIWAGYLINAIGGALFSGADVALYYDSLKELGREKEFAKYSAQKGLAFRTGLVISTFFGATVYSFNPRLPYLIYVGLILICAIMTYFYIEPKIDSEKFTLKNYIKQTKLGAKQLVKNRYIKDFSIFYLAVGAISWYYIYFLNQPLAQAFGLDAQERSYIFSAIFMMMAIVNYWLSAKTNLKRETVYTIFLVLLLTGLLPAMFVGKILGIFCLLLLQIAGSLRFSLLDQYANLEFESKYRATAVSTLNMGISLVFAIISFALSWMIESYSASTLGTVLGVVTLLVVTPSWWVLVRKHNGVRH